jgi:transcriptional regulator with XRE-family HTH domain
MGYMKWSELKAMKPTTPEREEANRQWVQQELLKMTLRDLREMAGKTQAEVATLTKMAQSELSKVERRADHKLSTLRRYVEALGGELAVVARFGDKSIILHTLLDEAGAPEAGADRASLPREESHIQAPSPIEAPKKVKRPRRKS